MRVTSPSRISWPRRGADQPAARAATVALGAIPAAWPTAAAARALWTDSLPSPGIAAARRGGGRPPDDRGRLGLKGIPAKPAETAPAAGTMALAAEPHV